MAPLEFADFEPKIVRCRLVLSVFAWLSVIFDPAQSTTGALHSVGRLAVDPRVAVVLGAHILYSLATVLVHRPGRRSPARFGSLTTWPDVFFAPAIAAATDGASTPFYAFFVFAVLAAGLRRGLRDTLIVTGIGVGLYLSLFFFTEETSVPVFLMRSVYLVIAGYLIGYLAQQRLRLEEKLRALAASHERNGIARALHDGFVQVLAGVNLRLQSCRELLERGCATDALEQLAELQVGVNREHDEFRAYVRSLAQRGETSAPDADNPTTWVSFRAQFEGSASLVDHVLQILREGVSNIRRHAQAQAARVTVRASSSEVHIRIDDDGVGLRPGTPPAWSIDSRVSDLGGIVRVSRSTTGGTGLEINLPQKAP